ncbi:hypothetical protein [Streptomyces sulphureus]|uniref:hypothetical protein n=1 Tax=Streptomyces sulphureus TaxID=47758 RepID=UPI00037B4922|nr:hypothetical protein [Streptomyces sulphureus]
MPVDTLAEAVRQRLSLGRLLPLGDPADAAWIAESAAVAVLLRAVEDVRGVRTEELRLSQDPDDAGEPVVEPPPSALPPGPLRLTATLSASGAEPFPAAAERLRTALLAAADERLGLRVHAADLEVVGMLEAEEDAGGERNAPDGPTSARTAEVHDSGASSDSGDGGGRQGLAAAVTAAVRAVPGVADTSSRLGSTLRRLGLRDEEVAVEPGPDGQEAHLLVQLATRPGHGPLDTARAARRAALDAAAAQGASATAAVLVTDVGA